MGFLPAPHCSVAPEPYSLAMQAETIFSLKGRNSPATGPTRKAQMIVPAPKEPPSAYPMATKEKSTAMRTMLNFLCSLSLRTTVTRSLGPVPASNLMTFVMPKTIIMQPEPALPD